MLQVKLRARLFVKTIHVASATSEKTFRKNEINVGMARYKHREKRGGLYIYVDHTINSARGQERRRCKVGGRVLNLWCNLHIYKAHLFSPDACTLPSLLAIKDRTMLPFRNVNN